MGQQTSYSPSVQIDRSMSFSKIPIKLKKNNGKSEKTSISIEELRQKRLLFYVEKQNKELDL